MAEVKKDSGAESAAGAAETHEQRYAKAVAAFAAAVELLHKQEYDAARQRFREIEAENGDEPALIDRSRTYVRICEMKLSTSTDSPSSGDDYYYRGVVLANDGSYDEALPLFDRALTELPDSAKVLYARASTWALKGNADAAVADLRRAIATDPTVRFQASNDPDFEPIREEPAFIDIIEPTPSGV